MHGGGGMHGGGAAGGCGQQGGRQDESSISLITRLAGAIGLIRVGRSENALL